MKNPSDSRIPDSFVRDELLREAFSWLKTILLAMIFTVVVTRTIIINAQVPSPSMENTIMTYDRLIVFRLAYLFSEPRVYDIVVFQMPHMEDAQIKRIMGAPGDVVEILNGRVYINDSPARSDFVRGDDTSSFGPLAIPEGHFFVLGDFRTNSTDSRHWNDPLLPRRYIMGRAIFRYFPGFARFSRLSGKSSR